MGATRLERLREGFWATVFGAGVAVWFFALVVAMAVGRLIDTGKELPALFVAAVLGVALAVFVGYRRPVSGYASLGRRLLFSLVFGSFLALTVSVVVLAVAQPSDAASRVTAFGALAGAGFALAAGAMARFGWLGVTLDHLAEEDQPRAKRRRLVALLVLGVAGAATLLGVSPGARCLAGSASSCVAASAIGADDPVARLRYARLGCSRGDAPSCAEAGALLLRGAGAPADPREAERLLRQSCALDGASCASVKLYELDEACATRSAFACLELSNALARGAPGPSDPNRARELKIKACRLGLDEACSP
jgi:hypothetical protein